MIEAVCVGAGTALLLFGASLYVDKNNALASRVTACEEAVTTMRRGWSDDDIETEPRMVLMSEDSVMTPMAPYTGSIDPMRYVTEREPDQEVEEGDIDTSPAYAQR